MNKWLNKLMSNLIKGWQSDYINEWINEFIIKWMNEHLVKKDWWLLQLNSLYSVEEQ